MDEFSRAARQMWMILEARARQKWARGVFSCDSLRDEIWAMRFDEDLLGFDDWKIESFLQLLNLFQ